MLPDKKKTVDKFSGYFLPKVVKNPVRIAEQYRDIPVKYETLVVKEGIIEHTFTIYRDYAFQNIHYLFQNHPLQIIPTYKIFENSNVGIFYNNNRIISEYLYSIVDEIKKVIIEEEYNQVYIMRFEMIQQQRNFFKYACSPSMLGEIPKKIGFFQGEPARGTIQIKDSTHSLNLLLFSILNNNKALIDFYFSYLNLFNFYNGYPVQVMAPGEFLDKLFYEIRKTFMPSGINSESMENENGDDGNMKPHDMQE